MSKELFETRRKLRYQQQEQEEFIDELLDEVIEWRKISSHYDEDQIDRLKLGKYKLEQPQ